MAPNGSPRRARVPISIVAIGLGLAFAAALALPSTTTTNGSESPNLLANGSFEQPLVDTGGSAAFSTGATAAGWRVVGARGTVGVVSTSFVQNGIRFVAKAGDQWLDLTGSSNSPTGVTQTVETTPGASYALSFALGNVVDSGGLFGNSSTVDVLIDGKNVLEATNRGGGRVQGWKSFTVPVTASSDSTTIEFRNRDPGDDNSNGLDAVALVKR